jgi:hypothetical protein
MTTSQAKYLKDDAEATEMGMNTSKGSGAYFRSRKEMEEKIDCVFDRLASLPDPIPVWRAVKLDRRGSYDERRGTHWSFSKSSAVKFGRNEGATHVVSGIVRKHSVNWLKTIERNIVFSCTRGEFDDENEICVSAGKVKAQKVEDIDHVQVEATQTSAWLAKWLASDEVDPYHFSYLVPQWAEETNRELAPDQDVFEELDERDQKAFTRWLTINHDRLVSHHPEQDQPNLYFIGSKHVKSGTWLVHFTNDPDSIAMNGFTKGVSHEFLHLSKMQPSGEAKWGEFSFAFIADSRYANMAAKKKSYGKHAVMFQTNSGVESFHTGDQENQVVFEKDKTRNRIVLRRDGDSFSVERKLYGKDLFTGEFQDAVAWVKKNFPQYAKVMAHARG